MWCKTEFERRLPAHPEPGASLKKGFGLTGSWFRAWRFSWGLGLLGALWLGHYTFWFVQGFGGFGCSVQFLRAEGWGC